MPEKVIATMHEKQEDGSWKQVAVQDVTDFDHEQMLRFGEIQWSQGRVIIPKREGRP